VAYLAPIMRADAKLYTEYRYLAEPPLDCAISAFAGEEAPVYQPTDSTIGGNRVPPNGCLTGTPAATST
jgi:hypothetical protein